MLDIIAKHISKQKYKYKCSIIKKKVYSLFNSKKLFPFFDKKDEAAAEEAPKSVSNSLRIHYPIKTNRQNDNEAKYLGMCF